MKVTDIRQRGAALLLAMLTVALVATLAAAALWQQWRGIEVEAAERERAQADWILTGALDWARLILREDGRGGGPDHLGEPWSVPLAEARLSTFLAIEGQAVEGGDDYFLSGQITDAQARMNVMNLIAQGKASEPDVKAFTRLFQSLDLDVKELETLTENLRMALDISRSTSSDSAAPLLPRRLDQLRWLGLSAPTLERLAPYISILPTRSSLNLNTASAEAIAASIPDFDLDDAQRLVASRSRSPFNSLSEVSRAAGPAPITLELARFSVATNYFEIRGRLRSSSSMTEAVSLVRRNGINVGTVWRERVAVEGRQPIR